ncbi:MAG: peroxidase family protein [Gemmobacter sp.]|uniref:peroxidase family protein n=1 Tax=Gemmobacter sp. TaxID=1898957 RepID=UPI00391A608A
MRHGQGFDLMLQDWLRLAGQPETAQAEPEPGFARYEPRFDYTPRDLLDAPGPGPGATEWLPVLARLATQMHLGALRVAPDGPLPAAYTYLGQFAVHDLVNSAGFRTTRDRNLPRRLFGNIQSPALDLASLYGGGPGGSPAFFEPTEETEHRARFRLGWMRDSAGRPTRQEDIPRIPLGPATGDAPDDPRMDPLLADTRNADNLILSQLAVLFMKAHNRLHDLAHARAVAGNAHHRLLARPFEAARCLLTSSYRRILRHDFLPRLVAPETLARAFAPETRPHPSVSLEAALAVLRFGHALVQPRYDFNAVHAETGPAGAAGLERLMDFFGMRPSRDLPVDDSWVIDWGLFLALPGQPPHPRMNHARRLGPTLAEPLRNHPGTRIAPPAELPGLAGFRLGLAFRTMAKGLMARLPTAQAVAREAQAAGWIGPDAVMSPAAIAAALRAGRTAACTAGQCPSEADIALLSERTPLFWYVLAEAAHFADGARLGPLGGALLAETFAMALADPGFGGEPGLDAAADALWRELAPPGQPLPATLPDLVAFAAGPPPA